MSNETDLQGLPLGTASATAAAHYREGVALMLSAWPGADVWLDAAIAEDPAFALAHAARARLHAIRAEGDAARACIVRAQAAAVVSGDPRVGSHVDALAHAVAGRGAHALAAALAHVERWPRDVIVLSLPLGAFGLLAFSGRADHNRAKVHLCERVAPHFAADDWWFLTYRGWSLAEDGEVARGRAMLERAFALRRANANCAHALTHALVEAGDARAAHALIADWLPGYDRGGTLHGHLAWHAALALLEQGDAEGALAWYGRFVAPDVSHGMPMNIVSDAASLLWRAQAYGHAVPAALWPPVADYARRAFPNPGHAFMDVHLALVEAASADEPALARRAEVLDELVARNALPAGGVVPAVVRAVSAFARGDHAACVRLLAPVAADVARVGGSNAQREVFEDTLLLASMRAGVLGEARALLEARLARRPSPRDAAWLRELARA